MEEEKSLNQEIPLETIYRYTLQENARLKAENEQLESKIKKLENSITSFKKWQRKVVERNYEFWINNAKEIIGEGVDRQECRELLRFFKAYEAYNGAINSLLRDKEKRFIRQMRSFCAKKIDRNEDS